jgi:hypothetical protein
VKKFDDLRNKRNRPRIEKENLSPSKWLINRTDLEIPENVQRILSLGPKYNPPFDKKSLPIEKLVCDIESTIQSCDEQSKVALRGKFVNILTNFCQKSDVCSNDEKQIRRDVKSTREFIKDNPGIFITKADKGNVTVVIDRQNYIDGMETMFSDHHTYTKIDKCKTTTIQSRLNKMVSRWKDIGNIDFYTAKKLKCQNGVIARAYGLPKIHKTGNLFRPIVSCIGTPLYNLSRYLCEILKPVVGQTEYSIRNSMDFRAKMKDVQIPKDHKLVSFDVVSLFTNIDNQRVLDIISRKWKTIKSASKTKLSKNDFIEALEMVTENCEFSFNGQKYRQKFGSPMGSPVSPMLANLLLEDLENTVLSEGQIKPLFYYRYVDDIICALPEILIEPFKERLNSYHRKLQFTVEVEENSRLAFLDTLLIKDENGMTAMNWYHKPTWSGRYLHFKSCLPMSYKVNTVTLLAKKILGLSDTRFHR